MGPLPEQYNEFVKYAEDVFSDSEYVSSFTAVEALVDNFLIALTRYLGNPQHASAPIFLAALRDNILKELRFRVRIASSPRPRGMRRARQDNGHWMPEQVSLVALYLAYRVEFGITSTNYDHKLLVYMAGLSETGSFLDLNTEPQPGHNLGPGS
jgi:hypothetical protein